MIETSITAVMILAFCMVGMFTPDAAVMTDGVPTIRGSAGFQLNGFIWENTQSRRGGAAHEFGHYLQQREHGLAKYVATVALPSAIMSVLYTIDFQGTNRYYALPWEADANIRVMEYNR